MEELSAQFAEPFADLYRELLALVAVGFEYDTLIAIMEGLGALLHFTNRDAAVAAKVDAILDPEIKKLLQKNDASLIVFLLQLFTIRLRGSAEVSELNVHLFNSVMNTSNWTMENISLFPAYALFLHEYFVKLPDTVINQANEIQAILKMLLGNGLDNIAFALFDSILELFSDIAPFIQSGWLVYLLGLLMTEYAGQTSEDRRARVNFIKGTMMFIFKLIIKYTSAAVFEVVYQAAPDLIKVFLVKEINFVRNYFKRPERRIMFMALTELLFANQLNSVLPPDVFALLLNALIENITNKLNPRATRFQEEEDELSKGKVGDVLSGMKSSFQRLTYCEPTKRKLLEQVDNEEQFFLLKLKEFYIANSSAINFSELITEPNQGPLDKMMSSLN
eukprot:TRINITY_DN7617_c0_g1_i3.p1 TRINITY_DN7617_c0_g1~~TRINITY_DN7617_c0_g1_i3.p1  ORF type:complete len:391 (+),score=93.81 TRINITY_DN7617_c0_g1_i3:246-1418(+)